MDYPKMLYKRGGPVVVDGDGFETLTVENKDDHSCALEIGWCETAEAAARDGNEPEPEKPKAKGKK